MNENDNVLTKPISPLKAIRAKCLDCSCKTMAARRNSGRKLKNTPNLQGNF